VDDERQDIGDPLPREMIGRDLRMALHEEDLREQAAQERVAGEASPRVPLKTRLRRFFRHDR
jgi:hypothetical protein